jgi:hypothetical protein
MIPDSGLLQEACVFRKITGVFILRTKTAQNPGAYK